MIIIKYKSNGDRIQNFSLKQYLDKIKRYLKDIWIDLQKFSLLEIQLRTAIDFISSKDIKEGCVMHSKSENTEFMSCE